MPNGARHVAAAQARKLASSRARPRTGLGRAKAGGGSASKCASRKENCSTVPDNCQTLCDALGVNGKSSTVNAERAVKTRGVPRCKNDEHANGNGHKFADRDGNAASFARESKGRPAANILPSHGAASGGD